MWQPKLVLTLVVALLVAGQDSPFSRKKAPSVPQKPGVSWGEDPDESPAPAEEDARPTLDSEASREITSIAREYFKAASDHRPALLARIHALEEEFQVTKADISRFKSEFFRLAKQGPKHGKKSGSRFQLNHPDYPGEYIFREGGSTLCILLHGGGKGSGDAGQIARVYGGMPGATNVYPTVIRKDDTAWNTEREEQYVLELLRAIRRSMNIDSNKVYLAGHSMGGYGTWSIGGRHADLFAAISPGAGGVFTMGKNTNNKTKKPEIMRGIVENLKNTPIWFYHGANDPRVGPGSDRRAAEKLKEYKKEHGPYDFVWKEYPNIGHGLPPGGVGPIFGWMKSKTRKPYPRYVIWEPTRSYKRNFYWLRLENPGRGTRVEAQIQSGNTIELSGNFSGLEIYLNDKMGISLSREVIVTRDGAEVFRGGVGYSVAALLNSIEAKRDEKMYFFARLRVN